MVFPAFLGKAHVCNVHVLGEFSFNRCLDKADELIVVNTTSYIYSKVCCNIYTCM